MPDYDELPATIHRRYIHCPHCAESEHRVCHLRPGQTFGPWRCQECNWEFWGTIDQSNTVRITRCEESKGTPTLSVLLLDPRAAATFVIVRGTQWEPDRSQAYYFEEHTCPVNIINGMLAIHGIRAEWAEQTVTGDEVDAHGIFSYLGCIPLELKTDPQKRAQEVAEKVADMVAGGASPSDVQKALVPNVINYDPN